MAIEIEQVDARTAPETLLLEMHEYYVLHDAELHPDDPPMPVEQRLATWRNVVDHFDVRRWTLRDDGQIVAVAVASMNKNEDLNNAFVRIHVLPDRRREGLAKRLAQPVLAALEKGDRGSVITDTLDEAPWDAKLESLGMKKVFQSRLSRLLVGDVDWDLMDSWIDRASERATDYEVRYLTFPIEEEYLQRWCDVMLIMNTAPREDLEFEDFTMTPEKWRDVEEKLDARGELSAAYVAVHKPTGDWVGLSEIIFSENHPEQAEQGDTAVDPAHRNKGLGRWLKAAMIERFVEDHPEVVRIDTDNADSNDPMLGINVEMGYRELRQDSAWQGERETIQQHLGRG